MARLGQPASAAAPKPNFGPADKALKDALGVKSPGSLQIKGANNRGNVVDVAGLVAGTSAADVEVRSFSLVLLVGGDFSWFIVSVVHLIVVLAVYCAPKRPSSSTVVLLPTRPPVTTKAGSSSDWHTKMRRTQRTRCRRSTVKSQMDKS